MRNSSFVVLTLVLALIITAAYAEFRAYFYNPDRLEYEITYLKKEIERRELEKLALNDAFTDFRVEVATALPQKYSPEMKGEKGYPLRRLASVVRVPDPVQINQSLAQGLFDRGSQHFKQRNYVKARDSFKQFIEKFSYSAKVIEAHFLLAESYYQLGSLEECTDTIHHMIEQFPESELTGFAMIRMGRLLEVEHRWEEAIEIYKTVMRSFPERDVASQAARSLRSVEP